MYKRYNELFSMYKYFHSVCKSKLDTTSQHTQKVRKPFGMFKFFSGRKKTKLSAMPRLVYVLDGI